MTDRTILWGASNAAKSFFDNYPDINIDIVVDNNKDLWGNEFFGCEIKAPSCLQDSDVVYIASMYIEDIQKQLINLGISEKNIHGYFSMSKKILRYPDLERHFTAITERKKKVSKYIKSYLFEVDEYPPEKHVSFLRYCFGLAKSEGLVAEFGVWKGGTLRNIASFTDRIVYGFDSFQGLPEEWTINYPKGRFDLKNDIPEIPDNAQLVHGFFDVSVPKFIEHYSGERFVSFFHIDCDLYSSTACILDNFKDLISIGTVIVFDEYFFPENEGKGEYEAWQEFCVKSKVKYNYLAHCTSIACATRVGVIITEIGS